MFKGKLSVEKRKLSYHANELISFGHTLDQIAGIYRYVEQNGVTSHGQMSSPFTEIMDSIRNLSNYHPMEVIGRSFVTSIIGTVSRVNELISDGGAWHQEWLLVQTGGKVIASALGIVGSLAVVGPVGIVGAIYAGNSLANSVQDFIQLSAGQSDQVGKTNYLKKAMVEGWGEIGELAGNEELGESLGKVFYNLGSYIKDLYKLEKSLGQIDAYITKYTDLANQPALDSFNLSSLTKDAANMTFNTPMTFDVPKTIAGSIDGDPLKGLTNFVLSAARGNLESQIKQYGAISSAGADTISLFLNSYDGFKQIFKLGSKYSATVLA